MIFNMHDLVFEVKSSNHKFMSYLKYRFQKFISKNEFPKIKFSVKFSAPKLDFSSYDRVSYDLYSKENKFIIKKENVTIFYASSGDDLNVEIYFCPQNPKHLVKLLIKNRKNLLRDYYEHYIIWRGIQNTLLSLLEERGLQVLHSSAIKKNDGATLFFGLGGVGKTTVALSHVLNNNFKLMGDNFILTDGKNVYPFLEPITLTKFKKMVLDKNKLKKVLDKNDEFNSYFPNDKKSFNYFCRINNIIFLTASKNDKIEKVGKSEIIELINQTLKILGETPEFTELNMFFKKSPLNFKEGINYYKMSYKNVNNARKLLSDIL